MALTIITTSARPTADASILALFAQERAEQHPLAHFLSPESVRYLRTFVRSGFRNAKDEVDFVVFPSGKPPEAFLLGLGRKQDWTHRRAALLFRRLVGIAKSQKVPSLAVHLPSLLPQGMDEPALLRLAAMNLWLAEYTFGKYQKLSARQRRIQRVELITSLTPAVANRALRAAKIDAAFTNRCRDLTNTPAGDMTPQRLAEAARTLAHETGCTIRVLGKKEMERERMGAVLGVAKGSVQEPRFIIMEYRGGAQHDAPLVFVGKGVTFDAGGIHLKPRQGLADMHMDMSGGAAVLCATAAIAARALPVRVVALVPAVENMPSGSASKPGDVLVSRAGITIEVANTDAEGRVILADALDFAKQYKPRLVVDLATLTGSAVVALGQRYIALFTPDDARAERLRAAGEAAGDPLWRLPMDEEYESEIKSAFADVANIGHVRYGDAIHGALFLKRFAGKLPWAHLDIAPTMTPAEGQHLAKGATGTGVRLLIRLAEAISQERRGKEEGRKK